jgi:hypothetical protein
LIGLSPDTIIPWLLGGQLLLVFLTLSILVRSWHDSKRSPYFFLRLQAAKRMQKYMAISGALITLTIATVAYAWQAPTDTTLRIARLKYAKSAPQISVNETESAIETQGSPATVRIDTISPSAIRIAASSVNLDDPLLQPLTLPNENDELGTEVKFSDETVLGEISFSTDISGDYQPVDPGRRFAPGFFTLYATFAYDGMADGLTWSWTWRRNGQVVEGGNQTWSYGENGPGYVYLRPDEGFAPGEYVLDILVNGQLMTQSNFMVTDGISANN